MNIPCLCLSLGRVGICWRGHRHVVMTSPEGDRMELVFSLLGRSLYAWLTEVGEVPRVLTPRQLAFYMKGRGMPN